MTDRFGAFAPFWNWLLGGAPRPIVPRQLVLVAGGMAGVGTSLVTTLLGAAATSTGRDVLVIDGDTGTIATRTRQLVPRLDGYDLVLVDAGSRLATIRELCGALGDMPRHGDRVLAVTNPEPVSIMATYALIKRLVHRSRRLDVDVLVNGADTVTAAAIGDHVRAGVQRFLRRPIGFAGHIPDDPALRIAHGAGTLRAGVPASARAESARQAVHELLGRLARPPRAIIHATPPAPHPAPPLLVEA